MCVSCDAVSWSKPHHCEHLLSCYDHFQYMKCLGITDPLLLGILREVGDEVVYTPPHLTHTPVAPVMSCVSLSPARTAPSSLSSLNKGFVRY